ncbi:MAG: hypothetical protein P1P90_01020 [Patescibacteria group bacterium]|nr:hypothetical protein [Patescibacteria group bacterium]
MPNRDEDISWELIRMNVAFMGWSFIIRREAIQHTMAITTFDDLSHYQTLHMFYSGAATSIERKEMLRAGYQPIC